MTDLGSDLINAWTEASKDLGIEIQTPFTFQLSNEETIECILLVKNFGSEFGTLVFTDSSWTNNSGLKSSGYGISTLGDTYRKYKRSEFIDMLNDWGYSGESKLKPSWYTGQPWGH